jgi:hypothetical protein
VLYTLHLRLSTPSTKGESSVACVLCHVLCNSDYPKQVLVTCTYGNQCPKCVVPTDQLGSNSKFPLHDYEEARGTYLLADGDTHAFHLACWEAGQKLVFHPFWETLLLTKVFVSITPNILHQLLQGVFKHLVSWLLSTFGSLEIDAWC